MYYAKNPPNPLTSRSDKNILVVATRKGAHMSQKKMGRPVSPDSKHTMFRVRLDNASMSKLDECAEKMGTNRSDIVRKGIDKIHDDLNRK
jgi:hypothetical protein